MAFADKLSRYKAKRNFDITSEPADGGQESDEARAFVIQKHWASRLHYDFRIELDGTMKSWAVPKGPSFDPRDKRMAVHVEDHPIAYNEFEGTIPDKQYGAGRVIIWDQGTWHPFGNPHQSYVDGNIKFEMRGHKMLGKWALIRIKSRSDKQDTWLLIKEKDEFVKPATEFSVVDELPDSVKHLRRPMPKASLKWNASASMIKGSDKAMPKLTAGQPHADALKAALPANLPPQLATVMDRPLGDPENWYFEIKFDGYRLLARVDGASVKLFTRNGNDWTQKLAPLHAAIRKANLPQGWYDGEVVVLNDKGVPDFGALQISLDNATANNIVYFIFDVPYCAGFDMRQVPLYERRVTLEAILSNVAEQEIRLSAVFDAPHESILATACQLGLEGVIAKRRDSVYRSARCSDWIKLKCSHRQEFVIGGWTDPKGARAGLGSLLLGAYDDMGSLRYAGKVGTGFNDKALREIKEKLDHVATLSSPFKGNPNILGRPHWVEPVLVAEVTFGEWTSSGHLRHSVFQGLRTDKPAKSIIREKAGSAPKPTNARLAKTSDINFHTLSTKSRVTNPNRVIDKSSGITKIELVRYYGLVGDLMMEHLSERPMSMLRAPDGIDGQLFFQKHAETVKLLGVRQLDPSLYPSHSSMLEIVSKEGLLSAAQWNVVELHTLNTGTSSLVRPDRIIFDLDPGEGVSWPTIQEAADVIHIFLGQLGLPSFLKTSGGKGLHIVVPLKKTHSWDVAKDFSHAVVTHLSKVLPKMFTAKIGPRNRVGKIFIDYLRNGLGATTVCAWSARARSGLGISVPVEWGELTKLTGGAHWTIRSVQTRLDRGNDPWKGYARAKTTLTGAIKALR